MIKRCILFSLIMLMLGSASAQESPRAATGNDPAREEWFMDQGLGMFIHWSVDAQLGGDISHTLVGASDDYVDRFFNDLPKTFNPTRFDPDEWVRLAKSCGVKYMVLTSKHHEGFCNWDTKLTNYNAVNYGPKRDVIKEFVEAGRAEGLRVGFYYSLMDWHHPDGARCQDERV